MQEVEFYLTDQACAVLGGLPLGGVHAQDDLTVLERDHVGRRVQPHKIAVELTNPTVRDQHHADVRRQIGSRQGQYLRECALGELPELIALNPYSSLAVGDQD